MPRKTGLIVVTLGIGIGIAIVIGIIHKVENIVQAYLQPFDSDSNPDTDALLLSSARRNG